MNDLVHADDFDPPLTPRQVEQAQEVINEALRRQLVDRPAAHPESMVNCECLSYGEHSRRLGLTPNEP